MTAGLAAAGGSLFARTPVRAAPTPLRAPAALKPPRIAVSSYSYWHFRGERVPIEGVIDRAAALGADGVEILHRQMASEDRPYLNQLKRAAWANGLDLVMLSIHQDFVDPDPEARKRNVEHTIHCLELAHQLGIPSIRLNSGRWGTIRSFDALMEARGIEPPLEGYTEDEAFDWCIGAIEDCLPTAERLGVVMALENHWGLTRTADGLLRIVDAIDSPWLGVNLDTGNFLDDTYEQIERVAPWAAIVQAKTYPGGGEWYTLDLDYDRIARILRDAGFHGYVSLEMEGRADPETAVPESVARLRDAFETAYA